MQRVNKLMRLEFYDNWSKEFNECINIEVGNRSEVVAIMKALNKLGYTWCDTKSLLNETFINFVRPVKYSYKGLCYIVIPIATVIDRGDIVVYNDGSTTRNEKEYERMVSISFRTAIEKLKKIHKINKQLKEV